jgi:C1A family cysteine protease
MKKVINLILRLFGIIKMPVIINDTLQYKLANYGCMADKEDLGDYSYENNLMATSPIYADVDLVDECMPPIFNQGSIGSCTAQSGVCIFWYQYNKLKRVIGERINEDYSRLFTYYMSRFLEQRVHEDCGSTLRTVGKSMQKFGVTASSYYSEALPFNTEPDFYSLAYGCTNKIDAYYRITTKEGIVDALNKQIPVAFSTTFSRFGYVDTNGLSRESLAWNTKFVGSDHAMVIVGFKQNFNYYGVATDVFKIRNSHGIGFGNLGYCYIPCSQLVNYNMTDAWAYIKDKFTEDNENDNYVKTLYQ